MNNADVESGQPAEGSTLGRRASRAAAGRADPRALRTRAYVLQAIRDAAAKGDLAALTVSEVCRRAQINRVTFYKHWNELADALVEAFAENFDALSTIPQDAIARSADVDQLASLYRNALLAQLNELSARRDLYRELLTGPREQPLRVALQQVLHERAQLAIEVLARAGVEVPDTGHDLAASYIAGGGTAALVAFTRGDDDDIERTATAIMALFPPWWPRPAAAGLTPA
ncbi:TetR/AcrR family transcriptional regulator [Kineosporia succinea]|uniref:AcrR family transcriptional regulator n=1 Tax=Kineosporia succinea TaxID=84632 RepID=A0ABT9PCH4_9ACTN|nr:TetR/AcrR family transcriptional regulator [Kineosporia succinea]MDP9830388.1 AcrR family transcriptional regulator [Kineosporia succinea]